MFKYLQLIHLGGIMSNEKKTPTLPQTREFCDCPHIPGRRCRDFAYANWPNKGPECFYWQRDDTHGPMVTRCVYIPTPSWCAEYSIATGGTANGCV